jgi:hypothetical protein
METESSLPHSQVPANYPYGKIYISQTLSVKKFTFTSMVFWGNL